MDYSKKLVAALKKRKLSLSLAESCSGGYASFLITKVPGCSEVLKGSVVVYSLETKNKLFNIPNFLLKKSQGVSKQTSKLLAERIKITFNSSIGASLVGFAGPTARKGLKVGTVFIAVNFNQKTFIKKIIIPGSRDAIRKTASQALIEMIYETVQGPKS